MALSLFVTCPSGAERALGGELRAIGASEVRERRSGAACTGTLETAYRAVLWTRTASRVLLRVAETGARTADEMYEAVRELPWEDHMRADGTLAVDFVGAVPGVRNTMFGAQRVKDAIVDRFRDRAGRRPDVDPASPDLRVNVVAREGRVTVAVDLGGGALHRRGYRAPPDGRRAPAPEATLKENLAAAVLLIAGWVRIAGSGGAMFDPMCGSGTLPIEAALIAGDAAPGLLRVAHPVERWLGHDAALLARLLDEAAERRAAGRERIPPVLGSDGDERAVAVARSAASSAGLADTVRFEVRAVRDARPPAGAAGGLVAVDPPYGERLAADRETYASLGRVLRERFGGWRCAMLATDERLAAAAGVGWSRTHALRNGPLDVTLHVGTVPRGGPDAAASSAPSVPAVEFANRVRRNLRHLGRWARREGVTCWRVYDADLPDFALAIDRYEGAGPDEGRAFVHVAEYAAPRGVDPALAEARLAAALAELPAILGVEPEHVFVKVRRRQRGSAQYERAGSSGAVRVVAEGGSLFEVNLSDYLDTGLFLDHRPLRLLVRETVRDARFLNLFGYTGAFTVHAAAGGASATTTVDLSSTYLDWARRSMELNGLVGARHAYLRADALEWLESGKGGSRRAGYDIVVCDPPSFSNSKRMREVLDVQRDHPRLIRGARALLAPGGTLYFSTNLRSFKMDERVREETGAEDITASTVPPDFARTPRVHSCWRIVRTS